MKRVSFENYGRRAEHPMTFAELAGRYRFQQKLERNIVRDVSEKLGLASSDTLLEIGCGAGNLLIPLSKKVRTAAGIDHAKVLARLAQRPNSGRIRRYPGNFLDVQIGHKFSKVLVYSVIHYLASLREVLKFLDKAVSLLEPGGALLVGDIPNTDRKVRFNASRLGTRVQKDWTRQTKHAPQPEVAGLSKDRKFVTLNDAALLAILCHFRACGLDAFLLPEPEDLCFAYTREDILVRKLD